MNVCISRKEGNRWLTNQLVLKQIETEMTLEQVKEQLTELGKRGVLTYEEIAERMNGFEIESDQMDEYYEYLGEQGIDLVGDNDNEEGLIIAKFQNRRRV